MNRMRLILAGLLIFVVTPTLCVADEHIVYDFKNGEETWGWKKDNFPGSIKCGLNAVASGAMNAVKDQKTTGDVYWIAKDMNNNGAYFCPLQIGANRKGWDDPYTVYYNIDADIDCIWLCKNGKGGDKCAESVAEVPNVKPIVQKTDSVNKDRVNREYTHIKFLISSKSLDCNEKKYKPYNTTDDQEHDIVLAVTEYTPDGYGAYVQPLVVRAAGTRTLKGKAYAFAYLAGVDKTLLCVDGYKHNSTGTGCTIHNDAAEAKETQLQTMKTELAAGTACPGWQMSGLTVEMLSMYETISVGGCKQMRCKKSNMGFKSDTDRTCIQCDADNRYGVNPDDGTCVICTDKQTFDANPSYKGKGYCRDKKPLTPNALQYGPNKTLNTSLSEQCWYVLQKEGFDKYKECINGPQETETTNGQKDV